MMDRSGWSLGHDGQVRVVLMDMMDRSGWSLGHDGQVWVVFGS